MSDYISRDAAKNRFQGHRDFYLEAYNGDFGKMPKDIQARVDEISDCIAELVNTPSADVAPVVRCKDCKHGEADDPDYPSKYYCHGGCGWNKADFYCAYGKRKDAEVEE